MSLSTLWCGHLCAHVSSISFVGVPAPAVESTCGSAYEGRECEKASPLSEIEGLLQRRCGWGCGLGAEALDTALEAPFLTTGKISSASTAGHTNRTKRNELVAESSMKRRQPRRSAWWATRKPCMASPSLATGLRSNSRENS